MTSHKQTEQETTKFQDFDVNQLSFTELAENDRSKSQLIAYPRYGKTGQALMLQAPWIKLDDYGVPRMSEYIKSDADRAKLKIPLNFEHPESKAFHDKLVELDAHLGSQEMKDKLFGKKAAKYKYIPIVRSPLEEDEDDENKKKSKRTRPYPPYLKPKIDTTWPETKIKTKIFKSTLVDETTKKRDRTANVVPILDDEGKNVVDEDGNPTYRPIETVLEYAEFVTYQSNVRAIISPVKLWAQKKPSGTDPMMQYGLMFKIIKMEVEPGAGSGNSLLASYRNNDKFIDSDDEGETTQFRGPPSAPSKSAATPLPLKKTVSAPPPEEEEEEEEEEEQEAEEVEEEEEEEEEPEPEPEPVKKGKGKAPTRKTK